MVVRLAILAHHALAFFSAFDSRPVAVTVVLFTFRFFTSTLALRHKSRHPLKRARVPEVSQLLGLVDMQLTVFSIATVVAFAFFSANAPFRETLTIHFETVYLGALAALVTALPRR